MPYPQKEKPLKAQSTFLQRLSRCRSWAWTDRSAPVLGRRHALVLASVLCAMAVGCQANSRSTSETASIPVEGKGPDPAMAKPLEQPGETHPAMVAPSPSTVAVDPVVEPVDLVTSEPPPLAVPPELSTPADDVVQLAQARVPNDVLLAYIEGATSPFELGADEILYLTDLGVPAETIAVMVRRDQELKEQPGATVAATALAIPAATADAAEAARVEDGEPAAVAANGLPAAFAVTSTAEPAPVEPVQPVHQVTHNHFYNALSPYGSWRELPDHGWVWQPSVAVVESDWRPYLHGGRWIWTDNGWYWHSFYSWGWAPFHYGRWHRSASWGWVWTPGTVWGPAWVTWRYYDGFAGWAPLPPACGFVRGGGFTYHGSRVGFRFGFGLTSSCYAFVPVSHFHVARPWVYRVGHTQVNQFYGNTTVINNYVTGNNNTIINRGIGTEVVTSRTELKKVRITDTAGVHSPTAIRGERLSRDGSTLAVHRPRMPEPAARPPAAITERQEQAKARTDSLLQSRPVQAARLNAAAAADSPAPQRALTPSRPSAAPVRGEPVRALGRQAPAAGEQRGGLSAPATPVSPRTEPQAVRPARPSSGSAVGVQVAPVRPGQAGAPESAVVPPAGVRPAPSGNRPVAAPVRPTVPERAAAVPTVPAPGSRIEPIRERPLQTAPAFRPSAPTQPQQPAAPRQPFAPSAIPVRPSISTPSFQVQPRVETPRPAPAPVYRSAPSFTPNARSVGPQPAPAPVYRSAPPSRPTFTPAPSIPSAPSRSIQPSPAPMQSAPTRAPAASAPSRITPAPSRSITPAPAPTRPSVSPSAAGSRPSARAPSR